MSTNDTPIHGSTIPMEPKAHDFVISRTQDPVRFGVIKASIEAGNQGYYILDECVYVAPKPLNYTVDPWMERDSIMLKDKPKLQLPEQSELDLLLFYMSLRDSVLTAAILTMVTAIFVTAHSILVSHEYGWAAAASLATALMAYAAVKVYNSRY